MSLRTLLSTLVLGALLFASDGALPAVAGPETETVNLDDYPEVLYVSAKVGSDEQGRGTSDAPYASIGHALQMATIHGVAILVAEGLYEEHGLRMRIGVDLFGGFNADDWSRNLTEHPSTIDALGAGRVLIAANDSRLDGFEVRGGLVRGPGAGILIDGTSPVVSNNLFTQNKTLGPLDWAPEYWHETAHDGAAIYCREGGEPEIRGNLIAANATENGRGAGIAYDGGCHGVIAENVLIANLAGTDDPMRSSDGGAISIFRWSNPEIRDNIILGNKALNSNDGGGVFVALWSSPSLLGNLIVGNEAGDDAGGLFVGGQEHRYDEPLDPLPSDDEFFVEVLGNQFFGNRNSSGNSGAGRITMESRGRFAKNILALNPGFYVQRSEFEVVHNTILENALLIETKQGLEPATFRNNIVLGAFESDGTALVSDSLFRDGFEGEGNATGVPTFLADGRVLSVVSTSSASAGFETRVEVLEPLVEGELQGRVVASGDHWGAVRFVTGTGLRVWGDLSSAKHIRVLPRFYQTTSSIGFGKGADAARALSEYQPQRVNKSIELLERGQPIYYASGYGGYDQGMRMASTWADYIVYNMEHQPLDFAALREFMRGLVDAGPTPSGHRTPTVIVVLPLLGLDEETVKAGGWMVQQALAQGVHGVHLARARHPEAVKRFVQAARFPIHTQKIDVLGEGLRGWGSHLFAAWVWGLEPEVYLHKADVWPLNPEGEIMLGVKLEDRQALANAEATLAVPGLAFAEHGPRDMGLSYGYLEGRADPPVPPEVSAAGDLVLKIAKQNGIFFLDNVLPDNVVGQIQRGVMIGAGRRQDSAEVGREHSKRTMPQ